MQTQNYRKYFIFNSTWKMLPYLVSNWNIWRHTFFVHIFPFLSQKTAYNNYTKSLNCSSQDINKNKQPIKRWQYDIGTNKTLIKYFFQRIQAITPSSWTISKTFIIKKLRNLECFSTQFCHMWYALQNASKRLAFVLGVSQKNQSFSSLKGC